MLARIFAILALVVLFTAGYATTYGRTTAILAVAAAIVIALARYGHEATALYLAERHRAAPKGQSR